ncbi:metal ABC transporter substrate-binding protein [Leucobacter chromiireducens]|uniref:Zinc ABC transporter substrate-binding protein n=1 Tax=Leucobacter chromiireducens subsp. solipictus TaxID=398235 RepID=A0ABS1SHE2_9MICO|nr:metal ABC transporter substrate-binding protein [Leucobacter chromiireducens]MBL3679895.1 zinc ABC transporter substrate-binding protein [Leucobacter chromiireducens subsp. solipictus]
MSGTGNGRVAVPRPPRLRRLGAGLAFAALLALAGCAPGAATGSTAAHAPTIMVTTNILGDVVENIVGDAAAVTTLMRPNADPHSFEISAPQAAALERADLVVASGLGLEEGVQHHLDRVSEAGGALFVAGEHITPLGAGLAGADSDPAAPDPATPDPHFWTDPQRMDDVIAALTETLTSGALPGFDPTARTQIAERGAAYRAELGALDRDIADRFAAIPRAQRTLVTNHHVFAYLAERYDFRILGTAIPGGTTLAAPSAADLNELVDAITAAGVPTIFAESSAPDRLMRVLADEAGIDVAVAELYTESLSPPGGGAESYLEMLATNAARIADGLGS